MSTARVRRPGMIQVHGVTTHGDVIWQIGNGGVRETWSQHIVAIHKSFGSKGVDVVRMPCGEFVNESDLNTLHDALKARNRGEGHPLCLSCHRQSVVLGLDVCSGCNDGAELLPFAEDELARVVDVLAGIHNRIARTEDEPRRIEPDAAWIPDDDDASHAEEQRRMGNQP